MEVEHKCIDTESAMPDDSKQYYFHLGSSQSLRTERSNQALPQPVASKAMQSDQPFTITRTPCRKLTNVTRSMEPEGIERIRCGCWHVRLLCVLFLLVLLLLATTRVAHARCGLQTHMKTRPLVQGLLVRVSITNAIPLKAFQVGFVKFIISLEACALA